MGWKKRRSKVSFYSRRAGLLKKKGRSSLPFKVLVVIAFLFLLFLGFTFVRGYLRLKEMERRVFRLRMEITHLEKENAALAEYARSLRTDPYTIEKIAREKLGLVREDEVIYKFLPSESKK